MSRWGRRRGGVGKRMGGGEPRVRAGADMSNGKSVRGKTAPTHGELSLGEILAGDRYDVATT